MKRILTLVVLATLLASSLYAQSIYKVNYDRDSRWFWGVNMGGTGMYQSDIESKTSLGWGAVFGKSIGMRERNHLSFDLRGRFFAAYFVGQATDNYDLNSSNLAPSTYRDNLSEYENTLGYFIPNYKTRLVSGSLELVVNTNSLRHRTGLNLYAFAGIEHPPTFIMIHSFHQAYTTTAVFKKILRNTFYVNKTIAMKPNWWDLKAKR